MPDQGYLAACAYCDWIAVDAQGEPAAFASRAADRAAWAHLESSHERIAARIAARIAGRPIPVEAEPELDALAEPEYVAA